MADDDSQPLLQEACDNSPISYIDSHCLVETGPCDNTATTANKCIFQSESELIVAVFVVAFDTRSGNVVEWSKPDSINLEGVEFKALISGAHTLSEDFVYFRHDSLFGVACYANMPVDSEMERGARMKSVGVLATSYINLYKHLNFLGSQVRYLLANSGDYTHLQSFYEAKRATIENTLEQSNIEDIKLHFPSNRSVRSHVFPKLKSTYPAGSLRQFIQFFGINIFALWKMVLLHKRILFFSPPPIGVVCYRVYSACCLGNHTTSGLSPHPSRPYFYINIADIDRLQHEMTYIACTTEKIFETKTQLYDIFINIQNIKTPHTHLSDILRLSDSDRRRYKQLSTYCEQRNPASYPDDDFFLSYFRSLNDTIFRTLLEVSASQGRELTSEHLRRMDLASKGDRTFLMHLLEHYGFDVVLVLDNPCCP